MKNEKNERVIFDIYPLFKPQIVMNNEKLFEQGDTGKTIYFISKGSVNIMQMRENIHTIKSINECVSEGHCNKKAITLLSKIL